jgi:hypothetical protein
VACSSTGAAASASLLAPADIDGYRGCVEADYPTHRSASRRLSAKLETGEESATRQVPNRNCWAKHEATRRY